MANKEKIIIAAGGTGGHLYPGIALAQELRKRDYEPIFILRKDDAGREILMLEKIGFCEIPICGMPSSFSLKIFKFLFLLIKGIAATFQVLKEIKPKVVVGMGGYISFPAVLLARLMNIPVIIHEQNLIPGLSNKMLFPFVDKVAISFEGSAKYFPSQKTIFTGNPLRRDLIQADIEEAYRFFDISPQKFTILVFGGSQGASKINRTVINSLSMLAEVKDKVQFIHIAGLKEHALVSEGFQTHHIVNRVFQYLHNMGQAYAVADLVICRAGATTVAELGILKKDAILIPFPYATANHQYYNACELVKKGLGTIVLENNLSADSLSKIILPRINSFKKHTLDLKPPEHLPQELFASLIENI